MPICEKCGSRIIIRTINGKKIPIHLDHNCSERSNRDSHIRPNKAKDYLNPAFKSFVDPSARCPVCREPVFYYENEYGSKVYFDALGPPWPLHPCTSNQINIIRNHSGGSNKRKGFQFNKTLLLNDWKPFNPVDYKIRKKEITFAVISGFILFSTGSKKIEFNLNHVESLRKQLFDGIVFIKRNRKESGTEKFILSVLSFQDDTPDISVLRSIEKYSQNKARNKTQKIKKSKRRSEFKNIPENFLKPIDNDDNLEICPLCNHRINKEEIKNHLKTKHWNNYRKKNRNFGVITQSLSENLNFEDWVKLILRLNEF